MNAPEQSSDGQTPRLLRRARRPYVWLIAGLVALNLAGGLYAGWFHATRPYEIDYGEGIVLHQARHILDRDIAYQPITRYPYVVYHYPPVFHLACRAVDLAVGDLLLSGRSVSFVCGLLICGVLVLLTSAVLPRRMDPATRRALCAAAGTLPLTFSNFYWTWLARTDSIALLFAFFALWAFVCLRPSWPADIAVGALFIVALFAKQTTLAPAFACLITTALIDRARLLRIVVTMGVLGSTILGVLAWFTHGEVIRHLVLYNQNPFNWLAAVARIIINWLGLPILASLAVAVVVRTLRRSAARVRRFSLRAWGAYLRSSPRRLATFVLVLHGVIAGVFTLSGGKYGSNVNYYLEWNLTLPPLAVLSLVHWLPAFRTQRMRPHHLLAIAALPYFLIVPPFSVGWYPHLRDLQVDDQAALQNHAALIDLLRHTPGPVLSEDMTLLNQVGKEVPAEPAIINVLAAAGAWDEAPMIDRIRRHHFDRIIVYDLGARYRWTPTMARAIDGAYHLEQSYGKYKVYRPN